MLLAAIAYSDAMRGTVDSSGARHLTFDERVQLAQVGVWSTSSIADETRTAIKSNQAITMASGVAALSAQHDTAALALMVASLSKFDTLSRAAGGGGGTKFADGARAYEILARGDTSAALLKCLALPTVNCRGIPCAAFNVARLLVRAKRETDAARVWDRWLPSGQSGVGAFAAMLLRAEIAARAGDKATAKHRIDAVIARWSGGSAAVQPSVKAAREGLRSLPGGRP